jgi:hypothetical protein
LQGWGKEYGTTDNEETVPEVVACAIYERVPDTTAHRIAIVNQIAGHSAVSTASQPAAQSAPTACHVQPAEADTLENLGGSISQETPNPISPRGCGKGCNAEPVVKWRLAWAST